MYLKLIAFGSEDDEIKSERLGSCLYLLDSASTNNNDNVTQDMLDYLYRDQSGEYYIFTGMILSDKEISSGQIPNGRLIFGGKFVKGDRLPNTQYSEIGLGHDEDGRAELQDALVLKNSLEVSGANADEKTLLVTGNAKITQNIDVGGATNLKSTTIDGTNIKIKESDGSITAKSISTTSISATAVNVMADITVGGKVSAITGGFEGNASTASKLRDECTITVDLTKTNSATFDGSNNIVLGVQNNLPITSTSGNLAVSRITGTLPVGKGGTGVTSLTGFTTDIKTTAKMEASTLNATNSISTGTLTATSNISATGNITAGNTLQAQTIKATPYVTIYGSTGNVSAVSYTATSDIRKKENISDFDGTDGSILDLPVKRFDFIDGKKNNIGCIAQDLQKICPELVHEDDDGYLSIEETKLVYLLLEEVKALKQRVDELENK